MSPKPENPANSRTCRPPAPRIPTSACREERASRDSCPDAQESGFAHPLSCFAACASRHSYINLVSQNQGRRSENGLGASAKFVPVQNHSFALGETFVSRECRFREERQGFGQQVLCAGAENPILLGVSAKSGGFCHNACNQPRFCIKHVAQNRSVGRAGRAPRRLESSRRPVTQKVSHF